MSCLNHIISPLPMDTTQRLSDYEFLCRVITKLNELITEYKTLQETVEALVKWVNEQLADPHLQELINNKLNEWLADGTIENIINMSIDDIINEYFTSISLVTNMRVVTANGRYNGWGDICVLGNVIIVGYTSSDKHEGAQQNRYPVIKYSTNTGQSWSKEIRINQNEIGILGGLCVHKGQVYLTWVSNTTGVNLCTTTDYENWTTVSTFRNSQYSYFVVQKPFSDGTNIITTVDCRNDPEGTGTLMLYKTSDLLTWSSVTIRANFRWGSYWESRGVYYNGYYIIASRNNYGYFNWIWSTDLVNFTIVPSQIRRSNTTPIGIVEVGGNLYLNWFDRSNCVFCWWGMPASQALYQLPYLVNPLCYEVSQGQGTAFNSGYNNLIFYRNQLISVTYAAPKPEPIATVPGVSDIIVMYKDINQLLYELSTDSNPLLNGSCFEGYGGQATGTELTNIGGFTFVSDSDITVQRRTLTTGKGGNRLVITSPNAQDIYMVSPFHMQNGVYYLCMSIDCPNSIDIMPITNGDSVNILKYTGVSFTTGLGVVCNNCTLVGIKMSVKANSTITIFNYNLTKQFLIPNDIGNSKCDNFRGINTHIEYVPYTATTIYFDQPYEYYINQPTFTINVTPITSSGDELPPEPVTVYSNTFSLSFTYNKTNPQVNAIRVPYLIELNNVTGIDKTTLH